MEFHEKLQALRKQKGLTQEEAAEKLFVSRAAVSKWESGRGYPNIDSLKALAGLYAVSIDDLLSGEELVTIAQEDQKEQAQMLCRRVFGLLDCCGLCWLFLPLFAQRGEGIIQAVSLLAFTGGAGYLRIAYFALVVVMAGLGVLALAWEGRSFCGASLALSGAAVLLFSLTLQPYGAALAVALLMVKVYLVMKKR